MLHSADFCITAKLNSSYSSTKSLRSDWFGATDYGEKELPRVINSAQGQNDLNSLLQRPCFTLYHIPLPYFYIPLHWKFEMQMYSITLRYIPLPYTIFQYLTLNSVTLHYISKGNSFHYLPLYPITLHQISLPYIYFITLHYIPFYMLDPFTFHYIQLPYVTFFYLALYPITLQ